MVEDVEGGCRCGRVRYRALLDCFPNVYACHCRDCQTWSGSAFSLQFVMDRDALHVRGDAKLFELSSSDGERVSRQWACPICFTRLFNTNSGRPGMAVVRAGTLDRSDELHIAAHIWTQRALSGVAIPDDVPIWPGRASPAELDDALSNR